MYHPLLTAHIARDMRLPLLRTGSIRLIVSYIAYYIYPCTQISSIDATVQYCA